MSSSAARQTTRRLSNTSTSPLVRFDIKQSHYQLQDALDLCLATQKILHTCNYTFIYINQCNTDKQNLDKKLKMLTKN